VDEGPAAVGWQLWRRAEELARRRRAVAVQMFVLDEAGESGGERAEQRREALRAEDDRWRAQLVMTCQALVDGPGMEQLPERPAALLALAEALQDGGDVEGARERLTQLVEEHPRAKAAPDAYLALASMAFADEELEDAARDCDGALRYPGEARRKRALYLKAWSLRGLGKGEYPAAMEALREIVRLAPAAPGSLEAEIDAAAERELVALYAAHGDPEGANAFFAAAGRAAGERLLSEVRARAGSSGRRLERLDRPED
jgi:tetratricopeptide (TPR) repeat protein